MKTSVERIDDTTVKLQVTVDADRVEQAIEHAAREVARGVRVPGFRPGKAPRRVLERHIGKEALLDEAVRHSLPSFYQEAVEAEELPVVGYPEFDVETFAPGEGGSFTAKVQVRPEIEVPDFEGLQVAHPEWEVTDEEVDQQIDGLRQRFAELETVGRPAQPGDHAVVSVSAHRDGELLEDVGEEDTLYEVRDPDESDQELDRQIVGAKAGDILKFTDTLGPDYGELAGAEVEVTTIVKEVKEKRLPELDDDFALTASEYDTFAELRASVERDLGRQKREQARAALRGTVVEALAEQVDVSLPQVMVDQEVQFRAGQISRQAEAYGLELDHFLSMMGQSNEDLVAQLTAQAEETVKAQLVVDAVGRAAGIEVRQEDLEAEVRRQAARLGRPAEELAEFMSQPDRIGALAADAFRRKTIDHLLEHVQVLSAPPPEEDFDEDDTEVAAGDDGDDGGEDGG